MSSKPVYTEEFYSSLYEGSLRSARAVIPHLLKIIQPASVIDVGCGLGTWLAVFKEQGIEHVLGVDGDYVDRSKLSVPEEYFLTADLTKPLSINRKFELAVSLEVAEHLPPECANQFVNSLCQLAPVILFSAALPYQGGTNHLNEQWPEYWRQKFLNKNFVMLDPLRPLLWYEDEVDWPYKQNLFLFVRADLLEINPAFCKLPKVKADSLMLITPWVFHANQELIPSFKRTPKLLIKASKKRFLSLKRWLKK